MGVEQFSQTVRGSDGTLRTNATGVMETDNYPHGGAERASSASDYPKEVNPAETMQVIDVTANDASIVIEVHTTGGDVFEGWQEGTVGERDTWEVDKIVLRDPNGTGATCSFDWAGE
jgi:hypothetical protein